MKKTNSQKGITLVALIITIIVLLILAVVAIRAVQGDNIIAHAENARDKYNQAQRNEEGTLEYYESYLSGTIGKWTQEGSILTRLNADGTKTQVKIGEYVNYNELETDESIYTYNTGVDRGAGGSGTWNETTKVVDMTAKTFTVSISKNNLEWRVLGVNEKGQLELISKKPMNTNGTYDKLCLAGEKGYLNGDIVLKELCDGLYGNGIGAVEARSLKVEDVNKLINYIPPEGGLYQYGWLENGTYDRIQYRYGEDESTITTATWKVNHYTSVENYQNFRMPGTSTIINEENRGVSEYIKNTKNYYYKMTDYTDFSTSDGESLAMFIGCGLGTDNRGYQWTASKLVRCSMSGASFHLGFVDGGYVLNSNDNLFDAVWDAVPGERKVYTRTAMVRPIVTLDFNLNFDKDSKRSMADK